MQLLGSIILLSKNAAQVEVAVMLQTSPPQKLALGVNLGTSISIFKT